MLLKMNAATSFEKVRDEIGGWAAMREFFGVSDAALWQWSKKGFPPHRALEVERRLKIPASDLTVTEPKKKAIG